MSRYVAQITFSTKFDGDDVTAVLNPLQYGDLVKIDGLTAKKDKITDMEAVELYVDIVPKYLVEVKGLKDAAGNPVAKEVVGTNAYFTQLLVEFGTQLLLAARPGDPSGPAAISAAS